jgi:dTDP-4-dehydrorhamnose 3,5-epimerase
MFPQPPDVSVDDAPAKVRDRMQRIETRLDGPILIEPKVLGDERGFFVETYRRSTYMELGIQEEMVQDNHSRSGHGIVRGMHFQIDRGAAKLVRCGRGAIYDVLVDVRRGSPTFGQWEAVRLDDENRAAVYVPEGVGHAFMALEDRTVIQYLCSAPYAPGREHAVNPLDPALGIDWPTAGRDGKPLEKLLSDKDAAAPTLAEAEQQGVLPSYDEALEFVASLRV